jgi:3-deoxy-D-manno-octulosonic-acid transferase
MRPLYNLLIRVAAPIAFGVLLVRGLRDRVYWQALSERFGFAGAPPPEGLPPREGLPPSCIWLHAVSLGEVSASAGLVRALAARHSDVPIVVTTATPTGRARALALFGTRVEVRYLPYDLPAAVRRFLVRVRPRLAIIVETELWPNLFAETARRGIPLLLASARLSATSVSRYRRFGGLFSGLFTPNVWIAAQTRTDAERFAAIGASPDRVRVVGNLKFDLELGADIVREGLAMRRRDFGLRPVWVAGSTHEGEEQQVLEAHARVRARHASALLLLVPRHPQRFDAVAALLGRAQLSFVRRSAGAAVGADDSVLLVDTVGELLSFYAAADVAFVGGSLAPVGGHNLLEPAALGLPVITGPSDFNGADIAALLLKVGAARRVTDAAELAEVVAALLADGEARRAQGAAGREAVASNRGSLARLLALIEERINAGSTTV